MMFNPLLFIIVWCAVLVLIILDIPVFSRRWWALVAVMVALEALFGCPSVEPYAN